MEKNKTPNNRLSKKEAIKKAAGDVAAMIDRMVMDLARDFSQDTANEIMCNAAKDFLNQYAEDYLPDEDQDDDQEEVNSVDLFSIGPDGIRQVNPEKMPAALRNMINKLTSHRDDKEEDLPVESGEDTDADDENDIPEFISHIMGKVAERLKSLHTPEASLEARIAEVQPDLRYFEKYMKSWVKKYVESEISDFGRRVRKAIKKTDKLDWKETVKLIEATNRKVRSDINDQIATSVSREVNQHFVRHHVSKARNTVDKSPGEDSL